jgi:adenine-specific DNA-methyltransferase
MKFIGNKLRLLGFIENVMQKNEIKKGVFMDMFAGTANVGKHFKRLGFKIISTDILEFSYAFQRAYIKVSETPLFEGIDLPNNMVVPPTVDRFFAQEAPEHLKRGSKLQNIIAYLNSLPGEEGFIFRNYCEEGTKDAKYKRRFFSDVNAKKIDAIRNQLELWKKTGRLTDDEFYVLLAELIDRADYVANNSGTYGAFLKIWRSMALKPLILRRPIIIGSKKEHEVYKMDANTLARLKTCDVAYLDPPYNTRQYSSNYHLLETIACWDSPPIKGIAGMRPHKDQDSNYSSRLKALAALQDLVAHLQTNHILLSYNNEGIIPKEEIVRTLQSRGEVTTYQKEYRRFRSESDKPHRQYKAVDDRTVEYLYYCRVIS